MYNIVRPVKFSQLAGQAETKKALKEAVNKGALEHSLIFYGKTGSGKTTAARIVGRALNCTDMQDGEPCGICAACQQITTGLSSEYVELNAATNGGKEDIDRLLSNISYRPLGNAKIFVIDEAQRLSAAAWSSLLKAIEEPPEYIYFILCTTEYEAIPEAIKNRCGKYEFKSITDEDMFNYLQDLRPQYGQNYSNEALKAIAENSEGSMRNAVNNFEHIRIPYPEDFQIGATEVAQYLAILGEDMLSEFIIALANGQFKQALFTVDEAENRAVNSRTFVKNVCETIADAISASYTDNPAGKKLSDSVTLSNLTKIGNTINSVYADSEKSYSGIRLAVAQLCTTAETDKSVGNGKNLALLEKQLQEALCRIAQLEETVKSLQTGERTQVTQQTENIISSILEEENNNDDFEYEELEDSELPDSFEYIMDEEDESSFEDEEDESFIDLNDEDSIKETKETLFSQFFSVPQSEQIDDTLQNYENNEQPEEFSVVQYSDSDSDSDSDSEEEPFNTDNTKEALFNASRCNISFSNPLLAKEFKLANSISHKADSQLNAAMEENAILKTLVTVNCKKNMTEKGIVLATPFIPAKEILDAYINYMNLKNINVVICEGMAI